MKTLAALVVLVPSLAAAQPQDTSAVEVSGFVTYGAGDLSGTVTDIDDGTPRSGVKVHVAPSGAREQIVTTDAKGVFRAKVASEAATYVFVEAKVKIIGQLASAVKEGESEAIAIRETLPPVVQPKAKIAVDYVPDYSETAEDKNTWTRAWLLLDVTAAGKVRRVKLINPPGLDLDAIAIKEAFKIQFEPARDRSNAKVSALVLWTWEWPNYYWMIEHKRNIHRLPAITSMIECRGSGPNRALRDCTKPAIAKAVSLPWIDKP